MVDVRRLGGLGDGAWQRLLPTLLGVPSFCHGKCIVMSISFGRSGWLSFNLLLLLSSCKGILR